MDTAEFVDQREALLESIQRDEAEMRVAVHELTDVARREFDISERIRAYPLAWLAGGFLLGLWLAQRGRRN